MVKANGRNLPKGENWHLELFKYFCDPPDKNLPLLFNEELEKKMGNFRRFRHVVFHGYGFRLDWNIMFEGSQYVTETFAKFKFAISKYLSANDLQ